MEWSNIFSSQRSETDVKFEGPRSDYQVDFDRLIFSSGFRRLQDKTQVFPLPGSTFVHNRLTHSLEVASVGRSLGKMIGTRIAELNPGLNEHAQTFYRYELSNVIAAACLAHDIGNPAFGHSGEKAISNYFRQSGSQIIDGASLKSYFNEKEWADLINFEGNANAFRILTHQFNGKSEGGLRLTYSTLASILKYPCESIAYDKAFAHRKKYGFFQTEKEKVEVICKALNMIKEDGANVCYKRHPFVYLTEAADDICYRVIDLEDAQRLGIIAAHEVERLFLNLLGSFDEGKLDKVKNTLNKITDRNERIGYLRAVSISVLIGQATSVFCTNMEAILDGSYNNTLLDQLEDDCAALQEIKAISIEEIYNHETVVEIEIAGYNVMFDLLGLMIPAAIKQKPDHKDEKIQRLVPKQFTVAPDSSPYEKVLSVLDFVSGMTDSYATELYRKVFGIEIPKHK